MRGIFSVSFCILVTISYAQNWTLEPVGQLPFKTSNNAVALAKVKDIPYIFSFSGIDESLDHTGIHLKSGSVNLVTGEAFQYDDVPDTLGKVASAASTVNNKIYIIGGYHVFNDGSEKSSNLVHCFNPETGKWEEDREQIPTPIDDHVQAVWEDSLIYVISGWSDTRNVPDVQIYNPTDNSWKYGTSLPNNNRYMTFGASGTIIGNTIYYLGGASMTNFFPATFWLRIGEINPKNPTEIKWRDSLLSPTDKYYRSACANVGGYPIWFGGSTSTYNYNGFAYTDGSVVQPSNQSLLLTEQIYRTNSEALPMDIRGIGNLSSISKIIAGGTYKDRKVSNEVIRVTWGYPASVKPAYNNSVKAYPNPANQFIHLPIQTSFQLYDLNGKLRISDISKMISVAHLAAGTYWLRINQSLQKVIIQH